MNINISIVGYSVSLMEVNKRLGAMFKGLVTTFRVVVVWGIRFLAASVLALGAHRYCARLLCFSLFLQWFFAL